MSQSAPITQRDQRLPALITVVVLGLALSALVPLPTWLLAVELFGSELSLRFSGPAQLLVLIAILVCVGVDELVRNRPVAAADAVREYNAPRGLSGLASSVMYWALPTFIAVFGLVLIQGLPWWGYQLLLALLCGAAVAAVISLQLASESLGSVPRQSLRLVLNGVAYGLAYLFFSLIFGARLRSMLSGTAVMLVSGGLALELLRNDETAVWRPWLYATLTAILMGELTWVLNYTRLDGRQGGALMLLAFYVLMGLSQHHMWERLSRRVVVEYILILTVGLLVITVRL